MLYGCERMDYFKPTADFAETHSFRFTDVAAEVKALQSGVGLTEVNGFNRFEITGTDRHSSLDRMFCGFVSKKPGRVGQGHLLNYRGMAKGDATVANIPGSHTGPDRVWYGSAAAAEFHDMDWLTTHVQIKSLTNDWTILVLAGPKARNVLSAASRGDWSAEAFPWLSVRETFIGIAPAVVLAVSFSGELAYEIHIPNAQLYAAYLALRAAGETHGMRLFGSRAVESMRLEKGYLHWKADMLTEFDLFETGLDRFVRMEKGEFIGKAALEKRKEAGLTKKLVTLEVLSDDRLAHAGASVMKDGKVVGAVTSGGWGYRVDKNLAYAFVDPEVVVGADGPALDLLGDQIRCTIIPTGPYDPEMRLPRG